jgi:hypothetical protein
MAGQGTQVGSAFLRITAKTLPQDYDEFMQRFRQGLEQRMGQGIHLNSPLIAHSSVVQQGQQVGHTLGTAMGQTLGQGVHGQVQSNAPQMTAPISQQGPSVGQMLGQGIVAGVIAAGTGKLIAKGLEQSMTLQSSGNRLQASLGLSPNDAEKYSKELGEIFGGNFGDSIEDVENAMGAVLSSFDGIKEQGGAAVSDLTKTVLTMSGAFGIEASRSAQVLGQMVKNGLVDNYTEGADLLVSGMQDLPMNIREGLLDSLDEYGQFFNTMGIDGEEAVNMLVKSGKKLGEFGLDKLGDSVKEFGIRASDGSKTSQAAFEAIGLNATEMTRTFAAGGPDAEKAFQKVVKGLHDIKDPAVRAANSIALFGTPLEDLNTAEIGSVLESFMATNSVLGETTGAAKEASDALGKGMGATLEGVGRQFNTALGEIALPLLNAALPVVKAISEFMTQNKDAIVAIGGPLLVVGGILATIIAAISMVQTVMAILTPVIAALTAATWNWNAALFANPLALWTIAISAVILGAILLWQNWDAVVTFMTDSINWVMELLNQLGRVFSDLFGNWGEFFGGGGVFNIMGGGAMGVPMMAQGGLVPATPGGSLRILGEASQNEVVLNENAYNANSEAQTNLMNSIINNGGTSGGNTQNNYFPNANPRDIEAGVTGLWRQQNGM